MSINLIVTLRTINWHLFTLPCLVLLNWSPSMTPMYTISCWLILFALTKDDCEALLNLISYYELLTLHKLVWSEIFPYFDKFVRKWKRFYSKICSDFLNCIASNMRIMFVPDWLSNYINFNRTSILSGMWLGIAPRTNMKVLKGVGPCL
jgi:hypothetical protein